jgi:NAD+ kinase
MNFPYKTIGLVAKPGYPDFDDLVERISGWMQKRGSELISVTEVSSSKQVTLEEFQQQSEMILVLGGDGTFLAGGRLSLARNIPILGLNLGRLGFLTEITVEELFPTLEKIQEGKVFFETRHLLQARIKKNGNTLYEGHVINDAVIAKSTIARMLEIETRVNQSFLALFKADGMIIATPTGSTAYSLAAGGPIVFPTMEATIMTPICPHSLNQRPLVIPDNFTISVRVVTPSDNVSLTLDGQTARNLHRGEYVEITKSDYHLKIIKSPFKTYFDILKSKLRWAEL